MAGVWRGAARIMIGGAYRWYADRVGSQHGIRVVTRRAAGHYRVDHYNMLHLCAVGIATLQHPVNTRSKPLNTYPTPGYANRPSGAPLG
jgi:hypothetical protein